MAVKLTLDPASVNRVSRTTGTFVSPNGGASLAAWIKAFSYASAVIATVGFNDATGAGLCFGFNVANSGVLLFRVWNSGINLLTAPIGLNQWNHIAVTSDGCYINGALAAVGSVTSGAAALTEFAFGGNAATSAVISMGYAEIRAWDRTLTRSQILQEMVSSRPVEIRALNCWYPLRRVSEMMIDFSSNKNNMSSNLIPANLCVTIPHPTQLIQRRVRAV